MGLHCSLVHSRDRFLVVHSVQTQKPIMAYSWDNRVKFVVRYMYDIDNNGFLDKNDFECLAVRNTVIEGKGDWNEATFKKNQEVMANLWNEIPSWLILTRTVKSALKNLKRLFKPTAKAKCSLICLQPSKPLLRPISEPLTLTVTVPLALPNSELTA